MTIQDWFPLGWTSWISLQSKGLSRVWPSVYFCKFSILIIYLFLFLHCIFLLAAKSRQSCPTLCDPIDGSPPGSRPWDSPSNNTWVGCYFLLQYIKVKSESEVAQSSLTLLDPMDCSLPGSSIHGISRERVLEWGAIAFSNVLLTVTFKWATLPFSGIVWQPY